MARGDTTKLMSGPQGSMTQLLQFLLMVFAGWANREQKKTIAYLQAENRILRWRLRARRLQFKDAERRELGRKAKAVVRRALRALNCIVSPNTLLRWYRQLGAQQYDGSAKRRPGRPPIDKDIEALIVRMAEENGSWGYARIQGALKNLGHHVGRTTIRRVLADNGIDPLRPEGAKRRGRLFFEPIGRVLRPWTSFRSKL